ncbi:MAG TPA: shikimate dehydrogenase [Candidatus Binataceae bacterium]|nr:shikimate dehydrogenase [Candidatus Binataceae bacterium]
MGDAAPNARRITAATRLTAIFGDPVEHSLSPAMHNAAYDALGMDRRYVAFRVRPADLGAALRAIPALGIIGVNLTVPHKEAALRHVDSLSTEARIVRAVNCVIDRRGVLHGDNTDARGLELDLRSHRAPIAGKAVLIIGAGGAAASAVLACMRMRAAKIVIANRTPRRAARLARRLSKLASDRVRIETRGLDSLRDRALVGDAAAIVNATPMGLVTRRFAALDYAATAGNCFFYDLIYGLAPTPFLKPASALGRPHADGAGMLAGQGEIAFKLFNGVAPPHGVMRRALWERLGR